MSTPPVSRPDPGRLLHHHVVEVHEVLRRPAPFDRRPGEEEQVADQPFHLVGVPQQAAGQRVPVVRVVGQGDLELRAQRSDRALQLVGGVGDEGALPAAASSRRASIWFIVRAGWDLVAAAGTGPVGRGSSSPIAATSVRISSTGRSVRPITTQVPRATSR